MPQEATPAPGVGPARAISRARLTSPGSHTCGGGSGSLSPSLEILEGRNSEETGTSQPRSSVNTI